MKTTRTREILASSLLLLAVLAPAGMVAAVTPGLTPTSQPSDANSADGVAMMRRIAAEKPLRLSTEVEHPPERFQFVIRFCSEAPNVDPSYTDYVVIKEGNRTAVLIRTLDGLPYCYITEGLMVMVDRQTPGQLLVTPTGAPSVVYRLADQPGKLDLWISHIRKAEKGIIDLNVGPMLKAIADKARQVTYERSSNTVVVRTDASIVMLATRAIERPEDFGLRAFLTRTGSSHTIALLDPEIDATPLFDLSRITRESVGALGLPIHEIVVDEKNPLTLSIPPNFAVDAKERAAATKLQSIFTGSSKSPDRTKPE